MEFLTEENGLNAQLMVMNGQKYSFNPLIMETLVMMFE